MVVFEKIFSRSLDNKFSRKKNNRYKIIYAPVRISAGYRTNIIDFRKTSKTHAHTFMPVFHFRRAFVSWVRPLCRMTVLPNVRNMPDVYEVSNHKSVSTQTKAYFPERHPFDLCFKWPRHWRIQEGASPHWSNFFHFHAVFGEIDQYNRLAPHPCRGQPSSGKSWIRHCTGPVNTAQTLKFHNIVMVQNIFLVLLGSKNLGGKPQFKTFSWATIRITILTTGQNFMTFRRGLIKENDHQRRNIFLNEFDLSLQKEIHNSLILIGQIMVKSR